MISQRRKRFCSKINREHLFTNPLEQTFRNYLSENEIDQEMMPAFLDSIFKELSKESGKKKKLNNSHQKFLKTTVIKTQGIFRLSGNNDRINALKESLEYCKFFN